MNNELLIVVALVVNLSITVVIAFYGANGLILTSTVNLILVSVFGAKLITVFGLSSNAGNLFYAMSFFSVNLLIEFYGKKQAYKAMWLGFCGLVLFILMSQFVTGIEGLKPSESVNNGLNLVFDLVPRIAFASMVGYLISQSLNIWLYSKVKELFVDRFLWFRNIISVGIIQFIDTIIFFTIAFYGQLELNLLISSIISGYLIKVAVGVVSTPVIYLGKNILNQASHND